MSVLAAEHGGGARWAISAALALALHAGALGAFAIRGTTTEGDDGAAMEIELGLVAASPNTSRDDLAAGPPQDLQEAPPPAAQPEPTREEKTKIEPTPDGEITLPAPSHEQSPAAEAPPPAPATAPPRQRAAAAQIASWNRQIAQAIARHKGYPAAARARRETGTVEIAFTIDRRGMIAASRIMRPSGSNALDREALETLQRAQPFPMPPDGIGDEQLTFTLPLRFSIVDAAKR